MLSSRNCLLVSLFDALLDNSPQLRILSSFLDCSDITASLSKVSLGKSVEFATVKRLFFQSDEAGEKLSHVSNNHNIGNKGKSESELSFDAKRWNVLSSCCNNDLFESASNEQNSFFA